ncbi:portal protein [Vibrio phage 381E49-1]|nr:portal protein [Vibrio phage 381E49-1]
MSTLNPTYHPDYLENALQWHRNYDCVMDNIKRKKQEYLPNLGALPKEAQTNPQIAGLAAKIDKDWEDLTWRLANYVNIVTPTMNAITGAIMRNEPTFNTDDNPVLIGLDSNIDGKGNGLDQEAKQCINAIQWGSRAGWLVRSNPESATMEDWGKGKKLPTAVFYDALHIIDWDVGYVDGEEKLIYLSLLESYQERSGGVYISKLRVINHRINEGLCEYQIVEDTGFDDKWEPVVINGKQIDQIPFFMASSQSNEWNIDSTPLTSLAEISLSIYVMNAYSNKAMILANEAKWHVDMGEMDEAGAKEMNPLGFTLAGRMPYYTKKGKLEVVQPQFSPETENKVEKLFTQALRVGASLFEQQGNETATGAAIRSGASTASMSTIANNVEDTMRNMIKFMAKYFEGTSYQYDPESVVFKLNREYFDIEVNPQMIQTAYGALLEGKLPEISWFELLKRARVVRGDMTYEEYQESVAEAGFVM